MAALKLRRIGLILVALTLLLAGGVLGLSVFLEWHGCDIVELDHAGSCRTLGIQTAYDAVRLQFSAVLMALFSGALACLIFAIRWGFQRYRGAKSRGA